MCRHSFPHLLPSVPYLKLLLALTIPFLSIFPRNTHAAPVDTLLEKADFLNLAASPQWRALLHNTTTWLGSTISLADDPRFFISPEGRDDPRAELIADIKTFFSESPPEIGGQPAECAFIARATWLRRVLEINPAYVPMPRCARFEEWRDIIAPKGLTLIFTSAFLNNPASMFGHTFLRLDEKSGQDLLAYGAHYAAETNNENPLFYALKGVFGGYQGFFSVKPYYESVQTYNDLEDRDLWEYELLLKDGELDLLLQHLWELRGVIFDYYYFDDNCSFFLLTLLEALRPEVKLHSRFPIYAIPIDTLRGVLDNGWEVKDVRYRPSKSTIINHKAAALNPAERRVAKDIARGNMALTDITVSDPVRRAAILELAFEYGDYLRLSGDAAADSEQRLLGILKERSKLPTAPESAPLQIPHTKPHEGNRSSMVSFGSGVDDDAWFYDLGIRPAFHSLMDPEPGYARGAEIEILSAHIRQYESEDLRFEKLALFNITSLFSRSELFQPLSWKLNADVHRKRFGRRDDRLVSHFGASLGATKDFGGRALTYLLLDTGVEHRSDYDGNFRLSAGPRLGTLIDLDEHWRTKLEAVYLPFLSSDNADPDLQFNFEQRVSIAQDHALFLTISQDRSLNVESTSYEVSWRYYF